MLVRLKFTQVIDSSMPFPVNLNALESVLDFSKASRISKNSLMKLLLSMLVTLNLAILSGFAGVVPCAMETPESCCCTLPQLQTSELGCCTDEVPEEPKPVSQHTCTCSFEPVNEDIPEAFSLPRPSQETQRVLFAETVTSEIFPTPLVQSTRLSFHGSSPPGKSIPLRLIKNSFLL